MARIRTIKPEFWTDEKVVECAFEARLMFIGMFNFADDKGNLVRSPKRIKMQIFPADMIDCEPLIKELSAAGLISEYSVSGVEYIHIDGFSKHQKINRPSATTIPTPEDVADNSRKQTPNYMDGSLSDDEKQIHDSHTIKGGNVEDSLSAHDELTDGKERKGREGKRKGIKLICPIRIGLMAINLTSRKGNLHRKNLIQNQMMLKAKIQSMSLSKIFFGGQV